MARRTVIRAKVKGFIEASIGDLTPDNIAAAAETLEEIKAGLPDSIEVGESEVKTVKAEDPPLPLGEAGQAAASE